MRVSSATASLDSHEPIYHSGHEFGTSQATVWPHIKRYFHKLDRLMTAIAYAEAGNLEVVQKILDEGRSAKKSQSRPICNGRVEWQ